MRRDELAPFGCARPATRMRAPRTTLNGSSHNENRTPNSHAQDVTRRCFLSDGSAKNFLTSLIRGGADSRGWTQAIGSEASGMPIPDQSLRSQCNSSVKSWLSLRNRGVVPRILGLL